MDAQPVLAVPAPQQGACAPAPLPGRDASPEPGAGLAPRPSLAGDAPAACSDISDGQLLAVADTAGLTADQLDRRHHLLRHSLPDEVRGEGVLVHFEAASVHEAVKLIKKMSQRDLQAKFRLVYGAKTFSNNNNWLRRKLFEAIGVDPAKGAVKKAAAGGGGRRRRGGAARGAARPKAPRAPKARAPKAADAFAWYPAAGYGWQEEEAAYSYGYGEEEEGEAEAYGADLEMGEEDEGACEALLALGVAAASLEESFSEASAPSVSVAPIEPTPTSTVATTTASGEADQGGSAAFRRLLLEQHEAAAAAAAAAAAVAAAQPPPAAVAEWAALMQQQLAGAGVEAGAAAVHPLMGMLPPHMVAAGWAPMAHPAFYATLAHLVGPQPAAVPALFVGK